jgi:hypothetical protein
LTNGGVKEPAIGVFQGVNQKIAERTVNLLKELYLLLVCWEVDSFFPRLNVLSYDVFVVSQVSAYSLVILGQIGVVAFDLVVTAGITAVTTSTKTRRTIVGSPRIATSWEDNDIGTVVQGNGVTVGKMPSDVVRIAIEVRVTDFHGGLQSLDSACGEQQEDGVIVFTSALGWVVVPTLLLHKRDLKKPAFLGACQFLATTRTALDKTKPVNGIRQLLVKR